ncbi:MAG: thioredoxin domain-containing protein [Cryobacterium sp.]|nr:thioredoxin domain-containing protein [Cryobacterium sp.]
MANALTDAVSPYLRQHADNPVDWFPWGAEAFAEAARRDVPVLVSIGYSTCHWCHVMARESFSDPELARQLNASFVAIKVDREEHPEVDSAYLSAASAFTRSLGWPLNVFATPEGRPFFAGTYWPPRPAAGIPAFRDVLTSVTEAWRERRDGVNATADSLIEALAEVGAGVVGAAGGVDGGAGGALPGPGELDAAVTELESLEDHEFGGFGTEPKFPMVPVLDFALGRSTGRELARRTLTAMASSDLHDPVEGGFFRYATNRDWSEPHYERMLYDNAGLLAVAARAGDSETAAGVAGYLLDVLRLPSGAFASAQDSESMIDGRRNEGGYFRLDAAGRAALTPPALDEKVITGWNGLAIEALAIAGMRLDRPDLVDAARSAADWLLEHHRRADGSLVHASLDGAVSDARSRLDDHGLFATGLLALACATGEVHYAIAARDLVDACRTDDPQTPFAVEPDPVLKAQGFVIDADPSEGAMPSGASAIARAAARLFAVTGDGDLREAAERMLAPLAPLAAAQPTAFGATLAVLSELASPLRQVVVVTDVADSALVGVARETFGEGVTAIVTEHQAGQWQASGFELFEGRTLRDGVPAAYVCEHFTCRLPATTVEQLREQLD